MEIFDVNFKACNELLDKDSHEDELINSCLKDLAKKTSMLESCKDRISNQPTPPSEYVNIINRLFNDNYKNKGNTEYLLSNIYTNCKNDLPGYEKLDISNAIIFALDQGVFQLKYNLINGSVALNKILAGIYSFKYNELKEIGIDPSNLVLSCTDDSVLNFNSIIYKQYLNLHNSLVCLLKKENEFENSVKNDFDKFKSETKINLFDEKVVYEKEIKNLKIKAEEGLKNLEEKVDIELRSDGKIGKSLSKLQNDTLQYLIMFITIFSIIGINFGVFRQDTITPELIIITNSCLLFVLSFIFILLELSKNKLPLNLKLRKYCTMGVCAFVILGLYTISNILVMIMNK